MSKPEIITTTNDMNAYMAASSCDKAVQFPADANLLLVDGALDGEYTALLDEIGAAERRSLHLH